MKFVETYYCSKKILEFINYFSGKIPRNSIDKTKNRAFKLEKLIEIYSGDELELDKIRKINEIYKSSEAMRKAYSDLERYEDDPFIGKYVENIREIVEYYRQNEEKGLIEISKDYHEKENLKFFEDYTAACQLIGFYIEYNYSPYLKDFLVDYKISEYEFLRFVEIVRELDDELYDKFYEKYENNKNERKLLTIEKTNNLYQGITTGVLPNGEEFNKIEAYRNLPFYDDETSKEILEDFEIKNSAFINKKLRSLLEVLVGEKASTIMGYIYDQDLLGNNPVSFKEEEINNTRIIFNDREMTQQDKDSILSFMRKQKIPFIVRAFNEVRTKYYNGELEIEKDKKLKKVGM